MDSESDVRRIVREELQPVAIAFREVERDIRWIHRRLLLALCYLTGFCIGLTIAVLYLSSALAELRRRTFGG